MSSPTLNKMGFDEWLNLAMNDPQAFESARSAAIQAFLSSVPERSRERLTRLQWRIDMVREHSKSPMSACHTIYGMMWDRLAGDNGMLDALKCFTYEGIYSLEPAYNAEILPFRPRGSQRSE